MNWGLCCHHPPFQILLRVSTKNGFRFVFATNTFHFVSHQGKGAIPRNTKKNGVGSFFFFSQERLKVPMASETIPNNCKVSNWWQAFVRGHERKWSSRWSWLPVLNQMLPSLLWQGNRLGWLQRFEEWRQRSEQSNRFPTFYHLKELHVLWLARHQRFWEAVRGKY